MLPTILRKAAEGSGVGSWDEECGWMIRESIPGGQVLDFINLILGTWSATQVANSLPVAPTKDRLVVRPAILPEQTDGGIFLPETSRSQSDEAVVLGCGGEVYDIFPGDRILFQKRSGVVLEYEDQEIRVLKYDDVIAKVGVRDETREED